MPESKVTRRHLRVGQSRVAESTIQDLQRAWQNRNLTVFLGAGVSMEYGFPNWDNMLLDILVVLSEHSQQLKSRSPEVRRDILAWMKAHSGMDPLLMGRALKVQIMKGLHGDERDRVSEVLGARVRDRLYSRIRTPVPRDGTTLRAVADFIVADHARGNRPSVVTFNFDDLLEQSLAHLGVQAEPVFDDGPARTGGLRILHPHGYLPQHGEGSRGIVLAEDAYHAFGRDHSFWAAAELLTLLRRGPVLMIGLSLRDPNLRRLLEYCWSGGSERLRYCVSRAERLQHISDQDKALAMDLGLFESSGEPGTERLATEPRSGCNLDRAVKELKVWDRLLMRDIGVEMVSVETFGDVSRLLGLVRGEPVEGDGVAV